MGPAGMLSLMNIKSKGQVGPGETEVDIHQKGCQPRYCDENGNPFGRTYFDGANPFDFKDKINRDNINGASNEKPPRRW